jgi:hypothetical protein
MKPETAAHFEKYSHKSYQAAIVQHTARKAYSHAHIMPGPLAVVPYSCAWLPCQHSFQAKVGCEDAAGL